MKNMLDAAKEFEEHLDTLPDALEELAAEWVDGSRGAHTKLTNQITSYRNLINKSRASKTRRFNDATRVEKAAQININLWLR